MEIERGRIQLQEIETEIAVITDKIERKDKELEVLEESVQKYKKDNQNGRNDKADDIN